MNKLLLNFFLLGLSLGAGPCLVTCGPLLISYTAGTKKTVPHAIGAYFLFSLSRICVYLALGVAAYFFGHLAAEHIFVSYPRLIFSLGGIFIILVGLAMMMGMRLESRLCQRLQAVFLKKDFKTILMLGLIIGMVPCLPFISLLSYVGLVSKSWHDALLYSFSFGLGTTISPLFALVALAGLLPGLFKNNRFYGIFNALCGLILVLLGIQLIIKGI